MPLTSVGFTTGKWQPGTKWFLSQLLRSLKSIVGFQGTKTCEVHNPKQNGKTNKNRMQKSKYEPGSI
ncbi:MAG: hypothetical protein ACREC8_06020 [Limisphaerales bacterium]